MPRRWRGAARPARLAAQAAAEDAVDEGRLGGLARRPRVQAGQRALMHRVQQADQVLVRVLLAPAPEAARVRAQAVGRLLLLAGGQRRGVRLGDVFSASV